LAFRGVDEDGDVASDEIAGLGVPYRSRQRIVPHRDGGARVAPSHRRQRLVHVNGRQLA